MSSQGSAFLCRCFLGHFPCFSGRGRDGRVLFGHLVKAGVVRTEHTGGREENKRASHCHVKWQPGMGREWTSPQSSLAFHSTGVYDPLLACCGQARRGLWQQQTAPFSLLSCYPSRSLLPISITSPHAYKAPSGQEEATGNHLPSLPKSGARSGKESEEVVQGELFWKSDSI